MRKIGIGLLLSALVLIAPAARAQEGPGRSGPGRAGFGGGGFGGGGFGGGGLLLSQKSVQEELKLNEDQVKQVDEFLAKQRESFGDTRDLSREERQKRFSESREAGQKAIGSILNEEQQRRFKQVSLQLQGASAIGDPEVAASLGLSDEQKKSVAEIQTAAREEMRSQFQSGGGDREKFRAARNATNEKLQGVLTPEQKTKWQELIGEPFKGELQGPQRGGEGQRRRRGRDGADANSTTTNALTADKSAGKADGDKKAEKRRDVDDKTKGDGAKSAKPRKHHGDKHVRKHSGRASPQGNQAHHRQGGPRGHHAQRGYYAQKGPHAHRGHRGHGRHEHARDARSQAWERVAHAVSRGDGPRSVSHRTGHRHRGRPEFARHDSRRSHSHHGRPSFHGPRPHHGSFGEHAQHAPYGARHHFAGHHRGPRHHGHAQQRSFHGHSGDFQRFAGHDGTHFRHPHHGRQRGSWQAWHREPGRSNGGPGDHGGARFHHVSESRRHHGPPAMHGDHHKHHRAHFAGFQRDRDDDRSHGEHRHHPRREGERDGAKNKHREGHRHTKPAEATGADARPAQENAGDKD